MLLHSSVALVALCGHYAEFGLLDIERMIFIARPNHSTCD